MMTVEEILAELGVTVDPAKAARGQEMEHDAFGKRRRCADQTRRLPRSRWRTRRPSSA